MGAKEQNMRSASLAGPHKGVRDTTLSSGTKILGISIEPEKARTLGVQDFRGHLAVNRLEQS